MGWWIGLGIAILAYGLILLLVSWFSVHPWRLPLFLSPGSLGTAQENITLQTADGVALQSWWLPVEGSRTVVLLCHGYMMNRSEPAPVAAMLWREGYSCLMFDSRAHGKSGGKLTGLGFDERVDVAAALDWLDQNAPGQDVVIYGSSMGAAAASFAAAENPGRLRGLILDSAYSRLLDAVSGWWYFVGGKKLASLLYPTRWISRLFLKQPLGRIDVAAAWPGGGDLPVLFLHGDSDTLASPDAARRNMEAVGDRGQIVWFPGCGHSEGRWNYPGEFNRAVLTFLAEVAPARAEHASRQTNSADLA